MAAPTGNQFWKIRAKHGRDKLFATAELLLEACKEYFEWVDANPWWRNEPIKSGDKAGETMKVKIARPYTLSGLCIYIGANQSFWRNFKKTDKLSEDFSAVISTVEEIIETQQFEGASVGAFNANIIARKLGLADKQDITSNGETVHTTVIFENPNKKGKAI